MEGSCPIGMQRSAWGRAAVRVLLSMSSITMSAVIVGMEGGTDRRILI